MLSKYSLNPLYNHRGRRHNGAVCSGCSWRVQPWNGLKSQATPIHLVYFRSSETAANKDRPWGLWRRVVDVRAESGDWDGGLAREQRTKFGFAIGSRVNDVDDYDAGHVSALRHETAYQIPDLLL